jgi:hypothetical protein
VVGFEQVTLTEGGRRIRDLPNAGGNSVASEVMSFEVLRASYGADLLKTEMELEYFPMGGSITDYSVLLYDLHIGVSGNRLDDFVSHVLLKPPTHAAFQLQ